MLWVLVVFPKDQGTRNHCDLGRGVGRIVDMCWKSSALQYVFSQKKKTKNTY